LAQWKAPEQAPRHMEDRIFGQKTSWFRSLLGGSVRVPVPVLVASLILLATAAFLWTRKQQIRHRQCRCPIFRRFPSRAYESSKGDEMLRTSSLLLTACLGMHAAQLMMSGSGSQGRVAFRYETRIEPEIPGQKVNEFGGGILVAKGFHRFVYDKTAKIYYGYDLVIEPRPSGQFLVIFQPLSTLPEMLRRDGPWTALPLLRMPPMQTVAKGDTIAIDLFLRPATGQKIVDYLLIDENTPATPDVMRPEAGQIRLSGAKVTRNGRLVTQEQPGGGLKGGVVYLYVPGAGRYLFTLSPALELGFRKTGEIRGTRLTASWGDDRVEVECENEITPGEAPQQVYVFHDPGWRPESQPEVFHSGASDHPRAYFPKR